MLKANQFNVPIAYTGQYPNNWAGYTFLQWTTQGAFHPGIDWNWGAGEEDYGKPVQAVANGVCVHTSTQDAIGYGTIVVLKHELSDQLYTFVKSRYNIDTHILYSFYAHLKDEIVEEGKEYQRGDIIGYCGKSGTTVSHLHQELYKPIPGTQWRYWPTLADGWDQVRLKQYYIDTYDFVFNQPPPQDAIDWSAEAERLRIELEQRDAEKRFYEDIVRTLASEKYLNTSLKKDEMEKAVSELKNGDTIGRELWLEVGGKMQYKYTYPDAKKAVLDAIRSLQTDCVVPVPPTYQVNEKLIKEFNIFDSLFIRIYKKITVGGE